MAVVCFTMGMVACEPVPLPTNSEGSASFWIKGQVGTTGFEVVAGQDDYYMDAQYEAVEDVWVMSGKLGSYQCEDCGQSIEILIRDGQLSQEGRFDAEVSLPERTYGYYLREEQSSGSKRVAFDPLSTPGPAPIYQWDFGDGTTSNEASPIHAYTDPLLRTITVCLQTDDSAGCRTEICNQILLDDPSCQLGFSHTLQQGGYVAFVALPSGEPPFEYQWDFGDGFSINLPNPGYTYAQGGQYTVCLTVTDALQCSQTYCKQVAVDPALCEHNFAYKVLGTSPADSLQLGTVSIRWWDEQGNLYESDYERQPANSFFTIAESSGIVTPEGKPARRLAVSFETTVYNAAGDPMELNGSGVVAVGHP